MNKKKYPLYGAVKTKKNSTRKGVQLYKCLVCRRQFRWCSIAGNGNVECLSKRQTNYPPIIRTNPFECLIHQTQTTQDRTCLDTVGLDRINRIYPFGCNLLGRDVGIG